MNISMLKALLNACYQAKRVHELLPALPTASPLLTSSTWIR